MHLSATEEQKATARAMIHEGFEQMQQGDLAAAASRFQAAAETAGLPAALSNWALCLHMQGDHAGALAVLSPALADPAPQPFNRMLAALAEGAQGNLADARARLAEAAADFEQGLAEPHLRGEETETDWLEYSITLKQTAGALGDHTWALEMHRRWPGRDLPRGVFAAGVAAFNLERFGEAAELWGSIQDPGWTNLMSAYADVAGHIGRLGLPAFPLEYDPAAEWPKKARPDSDELRAMVDQGALKVRCLALIFGGTPEERLEMTSLLVLYGRDWGLELGRVLVASEHVAPDLREAAARSLQDYDALH